MVSDARRRGRPEQRSFERDEHAHVDESALIARLVGARGREAIMFDVGAHEGSALTPFLDLGWTVYAFEPDPANRSKLMNRYGRHERIHIEGRAVSDEEREGVAFYVSDVSTGISSLNPFHASHRSAGTVDTTTISRFCEVRDIDCIDFLKIDTEGHDLFVLRGIDWSRVVPDVVMCEFEDAKTQPLGYTFHDIAGFLVDHGFRSWVSEWHPVLRYGTRHDWRRLSSYPCELADPRSWGNLLAFRDPPSEGDIRRALRHELRSRVRLKSRVSRLRRRFQRLAERGAIGGRRARR